MKKGLIWFMLFAGVFFMGMHAAGGRAPAEGVIQNVEIAQERTELRADLPILPETDMRAETEPVYYPVSEVPEEQGGLLTSRTASVLEGIVAGMYELIVGFLYNIASLLF